jgi:hypothetical protein
LQPVDAVLQAAVAAIDALRADVTT